MTTSEFDWDDAADDIVIAEQAAVAVYTNPKGGIVIRQAGQYGPEEDQWIVLAPEHAGKLARALLDLAKAEPTASPPLALPPPAKDRTAAERQRRYRERRNGVTANERDGRNVTARG